MIKLQYVVEVELKDFDFWSGAQDVAQAINERENASDCWDYLEEVVNESFECGVPLTETGVNDFVWFDAWDMLAEAELVEPDED